MSEGRAANGFQLRTANSKRRQISDIKKNRKRASPRFLQCRMSKEGMEEPRCDEGRCLVPACGGVPFQARPIGDA
jgi:hypothetical protein